MKTTGFKRLISLLLSVILTVGGLAVLSPFAGALAESYWSLRNEEYLGGTVKIRTYTSTSGEMGITVDGTPIAGGNVTVSNGYSQQLFAVDTTQFTEYTYRIVNKKKIKEYVLHNIVFTVDGAEVSSASVYFDNTAPYINSWEELDPFGKKYTKYDMSVWPDDVIILNTDKSFELSFNPTDDGCGVKSVTAKLDDNDVQVPCDIEYDRLVPGFHTISYTLTDNLGNSDTQSFSFEIIKPEPSYTDVSVSKVSSGYRLSAKLSGSFTRYTAGFYLAEILQARGYENVTKANDLDSEAPAGERELNAKKDGCYYTYTTTGGDVYQTFDINAKNKAGSVCFDYLGETDIGNQVTLEIYSYPLGEWQTLITKTAYKKSFRVNAGKKGVPITDYASPEGIIRIRVRLVSGRTGKYLRATYVCPSIRFSSLIGSLQTGSNGTVASEVYTSSVTNTLGWYIRGEADYYYSFSPTYSFETKSAQTTELEQYNCVFNGDTSTRASVTWQTSAKTSTNVQIIPYTGIIADFSSPVSYTGSTAYNEMTAKYSHKVKLTGLKPGTRYWVRYGDSSLGLWSEPCIVETPSNDNRFSFAAGNPTASYQAANDNLNTVKWNTGMDFVVTTGNEASGETGWKNYFGKMDSLFAGYRVIPAAGPSDSTVWWSKYGLAEQSGGGHATGVYYPVQYKNALFLVINSNDLSAAGVINKTQLRWIEKTLSGFEGDWKFVVLNAPLTGSNTETSALEAQLCPLFDRYEVDFVISSGGYALTGDTGEETLNINGEDYYSAPDVLYVNAADFSDGVCSFEIDEYLLKYTGPAGEAVRIVSDGRFNAVERAIDALPDSGDVTLNDMQAIENAVAAYNALDPQLAAEFVSNKDKLDSAAEALENIIAVTPPEITVMSPLPKKAALGRSFIFPDAVAEDITDGDVPVTAAAYDPAGNPAGDGEGVTFENYGIYRIVYSSTDTNGNVSNVEFQINVLDYLPGDVNNNGTVSVTDALLSLRFAALLKTPDIWDIAVCDMNTDGEITITDSLEILRISSEND